MQKEKNYWINIMYFNHHFYNGYIFNIVSIGVAISIAVPLPIAGYGDSDYEIIYSDNITSSELCDNSIGRFISALSKSSGLS